MFCRNCGAQIPDDSTFCENCGAKIMNRQQGQPSPAPYQQQGQSGPAPYQQPGYPGPAPYQQPGYPGAPGSGKGGGGSLVKYLAAGIAVGVLLVAGIFFVFGREKKEPDRPGRTREASSRTEAARETKAPETAPRETAARETAPAKESSGSEPGAGGEGPSFSGLEELFGKVQEQGAVPQETEAVPGTQPADIQPGQVPADIQPGQVPPAIQPGQVPSALQSGPLPSGTGSSGAGEAISLDDFGWYFAEDFPIDGNPMSELQDLGGGWKSLIQVVTPVDGRDQCRMMLSDAEVEYMGYKVTLKLHVKNRYQYMVDDPDSIEELEESGDVTVVLDGDWDEEMTSIDVASPQSGLNCRIYDFVEVSGVEYGLGKVYNENTEIGDIALIREAR
ncbi:MAG: zinc-ribbon domain-containing protein [Clostridium sp.]|nr:zinc-ribbon domain-containing protein [Clostridium sp.]